MSQYNKRIFTENSNIPPAKEIDKVTKDKFNESKDSKTANKNKPK